MSKLNSNNKIKKKNTLRVKRHSKSAPRRKKSAVERAIEYGVDITLLQQTLKMTPTERVRNAQAALDSVVVMQAEVRAFRSNQNQE